MNKPLHKRKTRRPDKMLMERLEAEGFIEEPTAPKARLRQPLPSAIGPNDKITAEIIAEGRR